MAPIELAFVAQPCHRANHHLSSSHTRSYKRQTTERERERREDVGARALLCMLVYLQSRVYRVEGEVRTV